MPDFVTSQLWVELRSHPVNHIASITPGGNDIGLYAYADESSRLHLIIKTDTGDVPPPSTAGISCRYGIFQDAKVLVVASDLAMETLFTPFCQQIINDLAYGRRDPANVVQQAIKTWQRLFKPVNQEMDQVVQVGIIGELLTMKHLLLPVLGPRSVDTWSGPLRERHDFMGRDLHIEVKATRSAIPRHVISRYDQLTPPKGKTLMFVSVRLEVSIGGRNTLATLRDEIRTTLSQHLPSLTLFDEHMQRLGWTETLLTSGCLLRYELASLSAFSVNGDFPRMPDNMPLLPGVVGVEYTIDVSHAYELAPSDAFAQIALRMGPEL